MLLEILLANFIGYVATLRLIYGLNNKCKRIINNYIFTNYSNKRTND